MKKRLRELKKNPWILWIWNERRRIKGNKEYKKISDEQFVKRFYYNAFGKELDLQNPITFNEKLNWLKLKVALCLLYMDKNWSMTYLILIRKWSGKITALLKGF